MRARKSSGPLFHTTSLGNLLSILRSGKLIASSQDYNDAFVSLSEIPYTGDISHNDVILVFRPGSAVHTQVIQVKYTEGWYDQHPEHSSYIAGAGWQEQYVEPEWEPPENLDEDGRPWRSGCCLERG